MSFAYSYEYSLEIFVIFSVEGQVSRDDERYLSIYIQKSFPNWIE